MNSDSESSTYSHHDSDEEIIAALKAGIIKPGTTIKSDKLDKLVGKTIDGQPKQYRQKAEINNVSALNNFEAQLKAEINGQNIDSSNNFLSDFKEYPNVTIPKDDNRENNAEEHANKMRNNLANNEFKREALFSLEAKASALKALDLLEKHGIPVTRPEDYYAEMTKSDRQMEKVKKKILQKSEEMDRRDKLRTIRDQRKKGKEIQQEIKKKRSEEKKDFLKKVKKAQKEKKGDALFDDDAGRGGKKTHVNKKREHKDKKFGFGGKKSAKFMGGNKAGGPSVGKNRPAKASNASRGVRSKQNTKKRPGKAARGKN